MPDVEGEGGTVPASRAGGGGPDAWPRRLTERGTEANRVGKDTEKEKGRTRRPPLFNVPERWPPDSAGGLAVYHFTCAPTPIMRGCMTELANRYALFSTLLLTTLTRASEFRVLKISNCGAIVTRLTLKVF